MSQGFETESTKAKQGVRQQPKAIAAESAEIQQSLVQHFGDIKDPRVERTKKHQLTDILVIALRVRSRLRRETLLQRCLTILAIIAGAQGWEDIENYGISKQQWLAEFLTLPNGIPSDDTFRRGERVPRSRSVASQLCALGRDTGNADGRGGDPD